MREMDYWSNRNALRAHGCIDWPPEKTALFRATVGRLETSLGMLNISLYEAETLRASGTLVRARQQVRMGASLGDRLATELLLLLAAMRHRVKDLTEIPDLAAASGDDFCGEPAQEATRWDWLAQAALPGRRWRFLHRLDSLARAIRQTTNAFHFAATEIADGTTIDPELTWESLETLHDDLAISLQQTSIAEKSFLSFLPVSQLGAFAEALEAPFSCALRPAPAKLSRVWA